jgi:integrase/recombinase XerD
MNNEIVQVVAEPLKPVARRQAESDEALVELWLHGRSVHTQRAYRGDVDAMRQFLRKSLVEMTLGDLQEFADSMAMTLEPASRHRRLSAVKSLFGFAQRLGYLRFDAARPLRLPPLRDRLAERILTESEVQQLIALERNPRNHALLCLLYVSAIRVSECCALKWRDLQDRTSGGQMTIFGKGGKTNTILIPDSVWQKIAAMNCDAESDAPVFRSRRGRHLHPSQIRRIVGRAARRARIKKVVTPHFLRHSHASHALDRGAPIHLVQATLAHSSLATTSRYVHAHPAASSSTYLALSETAECQ